mmetsp:Transcript_72721/g.235119  ORF Transcript_72721/g.235119 Transcript_72721/m.235119 type:complete len:81 (+) Transcript_72721:25-267(+)
MTNDCFSPHSWCYTKASGAQAAYPWSYNAGCGPAYFGGEKASDHIARMQLKKHAPDRGRSSALIHAVAASSASADHLHAS